MGREQGKLALSLVGLWLVVAMAFWALAFYPLAADAPEWLVRTRYACFGAPPGGLPDGGGWITLVGGPLLLLVAMVVAFWPELGAGMRLLRRRPVLMALAIILVAGFVAEVAWAGTRVQQAVALGSQSFAANEPGALPEDYPRQDRPAPDFRLIDQAGREVSLASLHGKAVVLTFAFAHCTTVCPALVTQTTQALARLDAARTAAVLITLDPWRDRPTALPELAARWRLPEQAYLVSGAVDDVVRALEAYEVPYKRDEKTGDVQHPALVYVLDGEGKVAYLFNNPPVDWVVEAVTRLREDGS